MYKSDRQRVEDGIIPMILESLVLSQMEFKESYRKRFKKYLLLLSEDIKTEIKGSRSATKTLLRLDRKVIKHFVANDWDTRKSCMIISYMASALVDAGGVQLGENTTKILRMLNRLIISSFKGKAFGDIVQKVDTSAAKQMPRVLKIIQNEGYF